MREHFSLLAIIRQRPALAAVAWIKQGWRLFVQAPWLWIQLLAFTLLVNLLASMHPLLTVAAFFLNPFLTAGLYKSMAGVQRGESVGFAWLFKPLQEPVYRQVFLQLAALNLLIAIPLSLMGQHLLVQLSEQSLDLVQVLLFVAAYGLVWMMFSYAVAILYFLPEKRLLPALQASLMACWKNIVPLLLFALLAFALALVTIPTMLLGMVIVMPLISIAFFISFQDIFLVEPGPPSQQPPEDPDVLEV
ncbi:hypothetical protein Q3O60_04850 [Alkalimonas collagenimarina]|uniref:DUF624 domain-containing protein n=1 Tax=Alkalimonas collagenimarina TaxID=400390 RepID=A0ABT9GWT8_9GAMM|nr:hypothetical protein [Alkalimonas collagenimarina]MDP4535519.1 hypothetical protein [Alkalimonas collagenimarina]